MVTRENQSSLLRDSQNITSSDLFAEDFLVGYQIERQRIRLERQLEIEQEQKEAQGKRYPQDLQEQIKEEIESRIESEIRDRLPKPVDALVTVIEEAQANQLKVQDTIAPQVKFDGCGVSIESLFINYTSIAEGCRKAEGTSTEPKPFTTPAPTGSYTNNAGVYKELFNPDNVGKTFTLLWKYDGWVSDVFIKPTSSGGLISWSNLTDAQANALVGANIINIVRFVPNNPIPTRQIVRVASNGNVLNAVYLDGRVSAGSFADVIYPQQFPFTINNIGNHRRLAYRSTAKVIGVQKFNVNGIGRNFFNLKINIRTDVSIGVGGFPTYNGVPTSSNPSGEPLPQISQDLILMSFFKMAYSELPNDNFGMDSNIQLTEPLLLGFPTIPGFKKPLPPPPPPRNKCDCMSNCCPNNQYDLAEIKRLLRVISAKQKEQDEKIGLDKFPMEIKGTESNRNWFVSLGASILANPIFQFTFPKQWGFWKGIEDAYNNSTAVIPSVRFDSLVEYMASLQQQSSKDTDLEALIGKPVPMRLFDTDPSKPGNSTQTITPKTVFKAIEAVLNEVTLTQRIIGIDKLPAKVPKKWVTADNTYRMMSEVAKTLGVQSQFEFLKQLVGIGEQQTEITSLVEFLDWQSDQLDDVLGDWEIEVNIADGDLIKPGEQGTTGYVLNMAQAMQRAIEECASGNISNKALINMVSRVLIELQGIKQELGKSASQVNAIRDYLGFSTETRTIKVPAHCNIPKPKDKDKPDGEQTKVEDLSSFLEGTSLPIEVEEYVEKGTYQDILIDLQQAAAITRAKDYQRAGSPADIALLIGGLATAYGLLKNDDPNAPKDESDSNFDKFIDDVENDYLNSVGRQTDTPDNPYGKPRNMRPKIRKLGDIPTP